MAHTILTETSEIFATGVTLTPEKLADGRWAWVVLTFDEDSDTWYDGDLCNPRSERGDTLARILETDERPDGVHLEEGEEEL